MDKTLLSVGLDVGTTTTQLIFSRLTVRNKSSAFAVPDMEIAEREILYQSPVHFTPLCGADLVDGAKIRALAEAAYRDAGIERAQVDTGAIIITGETSRKENARIVLEQMSEFAGDFVVATAGPHLESVLAARGAGADRYSAAQGVCVLHMDIGGGTSNLALVRDGQIERTGCLNVGGRLLKFDEQGRLTYRSPVAAPHFPYAVGQTPPLSAVEAFCDRLVHALEAAAGLCRADDALAQFWTAEAGAPWQPPEKIDVVSFSGGVAECLHTHHAPFAFGDIGPMLAAAITRSRLFALPHRSAEHAIRATVIGAGCHSTQLSGSTVFFRNIAFPLKNLPVVSLRADEQDAPFAAEVTRRMHASDAPPVLAFPGYRAAHYAQVARLADEIAKIDFRGAVLLAVQADMAKALGHALHLRLPPEAPILCIDRVAVPQNAYLDIGAPVGDALPVVIKTLILEK